MIKSKKELKNKEFEEDYSYNLGHRQRMKEKFVNLKPDDTTNPELLEMFLFLTHPRKDVKPLAKKILNQFGSLTDFFHASKEKMLSVKGLGENTFFAAKLLKEINIRLLKTEVKNKTIIESWKALLDYARSTMGHLQREQFRVLYLNNKNMLITDECQNEGTINKIIIYPREIIKRALELSATAIILMHNHPSGDVRPSEDDIKITHELIKATATFSIIVHDHIIIGTEGHFSFKTHGII